MEEFLEPLKFLHFIFLLLGIFAHVLIKVRKFATKEHREKFSMKKWWEYNGIATVTSFVLAVIVWMVAAHDDSILDLLGLKGFTITNIFFLGFGMDATAKIFTKKAAEMDQKAEG